MKLTGNKILITGGGSGIGLGLTDRFVAEGNEVIICGRRSSVLDEVSDRLPSVTTRSCDLSIESQRIELFDWIKAEHGDVNVLINNAGVQNWVEISDADFYEKSKQEVEINVLAPLHMTTLFLQLQAPETLMNVTSQLSFVPLLNVPTYCSTKAFLHSLTISSRHQLQARGIEVIEIIPPGLDTDLGGEGLHDDFPPVESFITSIFEQLKSGHSELTFGSSAQLAEGYSELVKDTFKQLNKVQLAT